jgi:hypothetical protein
VTPRAIHRLDVRASARQVEAHEASSWRYVNFVAVNAGLFFLIRSQTPTTWHGGETILMIFAFLMALVIIRPWHRFLRVDMDTGIVTFQWRVFVLFPIVRREFDLTNRQLGVAHRSTRAAKTETGQSGVGCLMMALPFPLSLLSFLFRGERETSIRVSSWSALCISNPERDRTEEITAVTSEAVVIPFLQAVREMLPGQVELPYGEAPPFD